MSDATTSWIAAARRSHDRFVDLVGPLDEAALGQPAYPTEWTIADVASHLGSQAEIFGLSLVAGRDHTPPPGPAEFGPIWDRWNALAPAEQAAQSLAANERLVVELETMSGPEKAGFNISMFGRGLDLNGLIQLRLSEHVLHTWDIDVALHPDATLPSDLVPLILPVALGYAGRGVSPINFLAPTPVVTTDPAGAYLVAVDDTPSVTATTTVEGDAVTLPAEAFVRLLAGRLDPGHTPAGVDDDRISVLRRVFPGF